MNTTESDIQQKRTTPCNHYDEKLQFLKDECEEVGPPEGKDQSKITIADLTTDEKTIIVIHYWHSLAGPVIKIIQKPKSQHELVSESMTKVVNTKQVQMLYVDFPVYKTRQDILSVVIGWQILNAFILTPQQAEILNCRNYKYERAVSA